MLEVHGPGQMCTRDVNGGRGVEPAVVQALGQNDQIASEPVTTDV